MITAGTNFLLRRGVVEVIVEPDLVKLLDSGRPLRLKQGFDPSCPDIHLGHTVGLRKLRQFQEMGHQVILIVGDWTAQIGDPSGQSVTRPTLSPQEVKANAETYMKQFFKVVDKEKTQVRWQSEWFGEFGLEDIIKLAGKFTVAQMLAREDFNKRYTGGRPIAITEFLYPLLQAYDSLVIEADVEFGGIDQKFNCLLGRELQTMMGQPAQQLLLVPLLVGTDGSKKMSKSLDNYIGIDESANDIYGKVMSIPDNLIILYFELVTDVPDEELEEFKQQLDTQSINPMLLKKRLAQEIVSQFHNIGAANKAAEFFEKVVQKREQPQEIREYIIPDPKTISRAKVTENGSISLQSSDLVVMTGLAESRSEAKRLIKQGAIKVDGVKIADSDAFIEARHDRIIQRGHLQFVKLLNYR
ncbi:tyrosine--tRNA ligase [Chloroflexota bacterium]